MAVWYVWRSNLPWKDFVCLCGFFISCALILILNFMSWSQKEGLTAPFSKLWCLFPVLCHFLLFCLPLLSMLVLELRNEICTIKLSVKDIIGYFILAEVIFMKSLLYYLRVHFYFSFAFSFESSVESTFELAVGPTLKSSVKRVKSTFRFQFCVQG